jgi:SpoVK/Ycf46/Vps4 family AAA+-type ATPase
MTNPQSAIRNPQFEALLADLQVLDGRIDRAIERVRQIVPADVDPAHRGLVIEESDVDMWLSSVGSPANGGDDSVQAASILGQNGGRLAALGEMFGLGPLEKAMVLSALAPEVDLAYANLYSYIQDDVTRKYATLDLASALWCSSLHERLGARTLLAQGRPLRHHLLVHIDDSPLHTVPFLSRPLTLDARITSYLLGGDDPDHALGVSAIVLHPQPGKVVHSLSPSQVQRLERLVADALQSRTNSVELELPSPLIRLRPSFAGSGPSESAIRNGKVRLRPSSSESAIRNSDGALVVWMRGPEKLGKRAVAEHLAATLSVPLLVVDAPTLLMQNGDQRRLLYRALREATLQGAILFWSGADAILARQEDGGHDLGREIARLMSEWHGCALFDIRATLPLRIPAISLPVELDFPAPSNERRRQLWERALQAKGRVGSTRLAPDVDLALLTGAFRLTGDQIEAAADTARHSAAWRAVPGQEDDNPVTMRDLLAACRTHSNQGLGALSRKITPRYTWNDLVLPSDRLAQLREMSYHVRYGPLVFEQWGFDRKLSGGKGLNMLFAGQPGTGKTMAAEVIATDLGLELYKIDLSTVVSKYIGETEKNLEKIFREGQTSNAILFFDEADSLFGKRSEVRDSHDRYANIEISYLLQKMEEYEGIVILATNLRKNLDDAFIRRLHGAIEFPMPEEADRLEIWRRTFPPEAPLSDDLDLQFLAHKFKLSGGNIKNIVLEAAFFAAQGGATIGMVHMIRATRREHQKIGKLIHPSDFGAYAWMIMTEDHDTSDQ